MKTLTKDLFIVMCITLLSSAQLFGQEWSEEQKEAWKSVENSWEMSAKHDLEGSLAYIHGDYSGWWNWRALPANKDFLSKIIAHEFETTKVLIQDFQPVEIIILGNVAIVQYYYSRLIKDVEGKEKNDSGRWPDILVKQGDKWFLIADHGGSTE
jgi:hypothetical protein